MKRNFLLLALSGAFALALLGSAQNASAACSPGTTNGGLTAGIYAIKITGAVTDTGSCGATSACPDISLMSEEGIGVIQLDGACGVTGGELVFWNGSAWSSPTTVTPLGGGPLPTFTGTPSPAYDVGTYFFNANHLGEVNIVDAPSGVTFSFGVSAEAGGNEFRGARLNPGDPLIITGEKQAAISSIAPFLTPVAVLFDGSGGGEWGSETGAGFDAIMSQLVYHVDPETNTTPEGGGSIVYNLDNGYDSYPALASLGVQNFPTGGGPMICDYHAIPLAPPNIGDGTELLHAALNPDFGCLFGSLGATFELDAVLWGTTNQSSFVLMVGENGQPAASGGSVATSGKISAPGNGAVAPANVNLVSSTLVQHPQVTVTFTNSAAEPIDYSGISLSGGLTDVTIDGSSTCSTSPGNLSSNNFAGLAATPGSNVCTIVLKDSGAQCTISGNAACTKGPAASWCTGFHTPNVCCTGIGTGTCVATPYACCTGVASGTCAGTETGTVTIAGNDHVVTPATLQNSTGISIPVTCK